MAACLQAIARQTVAPFEVIVVDNNSDDNSVAIARRFDFVQVLSEPKQGVVYARNRGFNAAKGDIIGRIDADTIVEANWVETLAIMFEQNDFDAVSGAVSYYDLPWRSFLGKLDLAFRHWIADGMGQHVFLYGANMALRQSSWQKVRRSLCSEAGLHEDFDLAIHLAAVGAHVEFNRQLRAGVSLRRFNVRFGDYYEYVWLSPRTYTKHNLAARRMYPVVVLVTLSYFAIRLLYRCYDPLTDRLSIYNTLSGRPPARVNPATFVD